MCATGSRCTKYSGGPSVPGAPGAARAPRAPSVPRAPAAPGAPRARQSDFRVPAHEPDVVAKVCCFFLLPGTVGLLAASNMPAPPPSESKPMQSGRGAPAHAQNLEAKCILCCFCQGWLACAQQAICQYARRPCQKPMQNRARGARACSMFGGETHLVLFLRGVAGLRPASNMPAPPPSLSRAHAKWSRGACACSRFGGNVFVLVNSS